MDILCFHTTKKRSIYVIVLMGFVERRCKTCTRKGEPKPESHQMPELHFVVVPAPDTQPSMESESLTLATATKALSIRPPEEYNLLSPFPGLSAELNGGQRDCRSSRRLGNVSLMRCKDKQIIGMRRGLVMVMSL